MNQILVPNYEPTFGDNYNRDERRERFLLLRRAALYALYDEQVKDPKHICNDVVMYIMLA